MTKKNTSSVFLQQRGPLRSQYDRYKWSYNPYKWPYKWVTGGFNPTVGVITPFVTGFWTHLEPKMIILVGL